MRENKPGLMQQVAALAKRLDDLSKDVRQLKDILNIQDNWNAEIRAMIGHKVRIVTVFSQEADQGRVGTLVWSDRYNLCIEVEHQPNNHKHKIIFSKGGIVSIELDE